VSVFLQKISVFTVVNNYLLDQAMYSSASSSSVPIDRTVTSSGLDAPPAYDA
jgi:hypothetical protein